MDCFSKRHEIIHPEPFYAFQVSSFFMCLHSFTSFVDQKLFFSRKLYLYFCGAFQSISTFAISLGTLSDASWHRAFRRRRLRSERCSWRSPQGRLGDRVLDLAPGPQTLGPSLFPVRLTAVYSWIILKKFFFVKGLLLIKILPTLKTGWLLAARPILSGVLWQKCAVDVWPWESTEARENQKGERREDVFS